MENLNPIYTNNQKSKFNYNLKLKIMKKLISMKDFVLDRYDKVFYGRANGKNAENYISQTNAYAKFLSQPLTLSMFVATDEDGNVIKIDTEHLEDSSSWSPDEIVQYQKAKERVLFEGFEICNRLESVKCVVNNDFHFSYDKAIERGETIESLIRYDLTLTETAKNMIKKDIFG